MLLEISKNSQENTCARAFFNKVAGLSLATLLKKRLQYRCFPVNFATFLRTPFLQTTPGRLLLTLYDPEDTPEAAVCRCSKLHNIYRKKKLQHRRFSVNIAEFLEQLFYRIPLVAASHPLTLTSMTSIIILLLNFIYNTLLVVCVCMCSGRVHKIPFSEHIFYRNTLDDSHITRLVQEQFPYKIFKILPGLKFVRTAILY